MAGSRGVFRNVNILHEFNESSGSQLIDIYQPGWLNPTDIVNNAKYSGFVTSLRLTIDISSIQPLTVVEGDILDTDTTVTENTKQTFNGNNKKCLSFYMRTASTPMVKIVDVFMFNQRPYYYLDLITYFTSAGTFDIAPDSIISCQIRDVGDGLLDLDDRVLLLGCVVEESPYFDQNSLLV